MARRPPRIAFFGLFGVGNFGNEGSLQALHVALRAALPDASFACICGNPPAVEAEHGLEAHPISAGGFTARWARALDKLLLGMPSRIANVLHAARTVRRFDAMIIPGTGILDDFADGPGGMPYALLRWCLLARLSGVRIAFVSIGAGPIRHPLSRLFMVQAARVAHYRSYRDEVSRDFMRALGFPESEPVMPDLAFSLPAPSATSSAPPGRELVGVGLMSYYGWRADPVDGPRIYAAYRDTIVDFIVWLLESGRGVKLVIGDIADRHAAAEIAALVRERAPAAAAAMTVAAEVASLSRVMAALADTDVVVATRFHNVVCALKVAKPTISIGYAAKNEALLEAVGLGDYALHIESIALPELQAKLTAMLANRAGLRERVIEGMARYEARLAAQVESVIDRLGLGAPASSDAAAARPLAERPSAP